MRRPCSTFAQRRVARRCSSQLPVARSPRSIHPKVVSDDCAKILERTHLSAELAHADALKWQPGRQFDAILLDAPCSATGTFRRHPEVLYRARPNVIARQCRAPAQSPRSSVSLAEARRNPGLFRLFARAAGGRRDNGRFLGEPQRTRHANRQRPARFRSSDRAWLGSHPSWPARSGRRT